MEADPRFFPSFDFALVVRTKASKPSPELGERPQIAKHCLLSLVSEATLRCSKNLTMPDTVLHHRGNYLVRRLSLAPGEATPWHRDPFHRVTVVVSGEALSIEYRDGGMAERVEAIAGQTDWDEPTDRVHRAVNVGNQTYEEITIFLLDRPDAVPQPNAEPE
jgi:quercetin dioxygenase-like cupin family protein